MTPIYNKQFTSILNMAKSFENLENILRDWAKENDERMSCRCRGCE